MVQRPLLKLGCKRSALKGARLASLLSGGAALLLGMVQGDAAWAQESVQANNPIGGSISLNLQNEYIGNLSDIDESANVLNFRSVFPFQAFGGDWVIRATIPVVTLPVPVSAAPLRFDHDTGLGDINVFAVRLLDLGTPTVSFGIGPGSRS